jgi:NADP-dependent 3-hydroxy acid dehydrogenase YdfG
MSDVIGVEGKVVVITGASSGIGEATARMLARRGALVVAGARRTEKLAHLVSIIREAGGTAEYQAVDITKRDQVEALVQRAKTAYGRVDVIINNAGIMPLSNLDRLEVDNWDRMIDVNIKGVLYGIAAGLPIMQAQKSGHFINIASIGAYSVSPTAAVYCATKFAVKAISDGLRQEVGKDIRVTVISPGVVESELAETITDSDAQQAMKVFRANAMSPDAIANAIAYVIEQPRDVDVSEMIVRPAGGF